jgi:hypothetical protein
MSNDDDVVIRGILIDGIAEVSIGSERLTLPPLRRDEARHSPAGFNWGYSGSGPAELARAVLIACCPDDDFVRQPYVYQSFKAVYVSVIRTEAWALRRSEVRRWVERVKSTDAGRRILHDLEERRRLDAEIARLDEAERREAASS